MGSGKWVAGFGFRVSGFGFRVSGFGFRVSGFGFWVSGFRVRVSGFRFRVSGLGWRPQQLQSSRQGAAPKALIPPASFGLRGLVFGCGVCGVVSDQILERISFKPVSTIETLEPFLIAESPLRNLRGDSGLLLGRMRA